MASNNIDIMFLESQLSALKQIADKALDEDCSIALYSDGSLTVDTPTRGRAFDTIRAMMSDLEEYNSNG